MSTEYKETSIKLAKIIYNISNGINLNDFNNMTPNELQNMIYDKIDKLLNEIDIPDNYSIDDMAEVYKILRDHNINLVLRDHNINLNSDDNDESNSRSDIFNELTSIIYTDDFINNRKNIIKSKSNVGDFFEIMGIDKEEFNNITMAELYPKLIDHYGLNEISNTRRLIELLSNRTIKPLNKNRIMCLERVKFNDKMENKECFICLSDYKNEDTLINLQCHHYSHSECMEKWLSITNTCPICRKTVE